MKTFAKGILATGLFLALAIAVSVFIFPPSHAQAPPAAAGQKAYINSAATTIVKPSNAFLHTVTINSNTTAGTVTLFDIAPSGCTGTPASGKFATITATATAVPVTLTYDVVTINGLCVLTSQATDLTVSFN